MKIIKLLGLLAVLSFLMVPILSGNTPKICECASGICHGSLKDSHEKNCCSKQPNDTSISQGCTCFNDIASIAGTAEFYVYDPGNCNFGKSSARSYARQSSAERFTCANGAGTCLIASPVNPNNIEPPDPYVVECLPPSAKQVFNILASNGPLTQKDLINKADLPPRTVRYALERLKSEDMLEERFCFQDARQILYSLNG